MQACSQAAGTLSINAATQNNSGTIQGNSLYLGGNAITNGLTDPIL